MNLCQMESILADDRQINLIVLKHERIVGRDERTGGRCSFQMHAAVHPGQQLEIAIGQVNLNQHRAGRLVERVGMTGHCSVEFLIGIFIH